MEEKFALVTGTSSGLGFELAQLLLEQEYTVIGVSRNGSEIDHPNYIDILCDIKDEASVEDMYEIIRESTEKIHLLVLNAGIFVMSPLLETSSLDFSDHFQTNVTGAFHVLKHAFEFLVEEESHIITISSAAAKTGLANLSALSASKFALNGMIESLKNEWRDYGFRFSTLMPGAIATAAWENQGGDVDIPMDQMLQIEDVLSVFDMVVNSAPYVQFSEVTFGHHQGAIR